MGITTINPATGETLKTFNPLDDETIEAKLAIAQQTFEQYRHIPIAQKAQWLKVAAEILERDKVKFGKIMTTEMGKTLKSAIAEVEKCALA
jgi:succinate-semialdehyde dehydrogenase/glutarate-semialdehyde dehydrogenase